MACEGCEASAEPRQFESARPDHWIPIRQLSLRNNAAHCRPRSTPIRHLPHDAYFGARDPRRQSWASSLS